MLCTVLNTELLYRFLIRRISLRSNHHYQLCLDPRVDDWPLMGSPFPTVAIFMTYLLITKHAPAYMANRQPFKLKYPLIFYNMGITIFNAWMVLEASVH